MDRENQNEANKSPEVEEVRTEVANDNPAASETKDDITEYRTFAILGYILPFLFFLPLLDEKTKNVPYVRFHANQHLILLVIVIGVYVLHSFLFGMFMMLGLFVAQVLNLAIIALAVIGIMNAYNGKMKELPFVGQFKLLK